MKEKKKEIVTTPAVDIALGTMESKALAQYREWIERLKNWDSDEQVQKRSHKLTGLEGEVYLLKTNSDLRIFFRLDDGGTITILDVAKKSTIYTSGHVPEIG
jgi:hypothetical protein